MARWVDVRVTLDVRHEALQALLTASTPGDRLNVSVDINPPSSAPGDMPSTTEIQLSIERWREERVRGILESAGIAVLAIRTRLDRTLVIPADG